MKFFNICILSFFLSGLYCSGQDLQLVNSSLAPKINFSAGTSPSGICVADINGDAKPEVIMVGSTNILSIYKNISTNGSISSNSLSPKVDFTTPNSPSIAITGDMDGDGKTDILTLNLTGSVSIFRNISTGDVNTGCLASPVYLTLSGSPQSILIADIDGDGKMDVLVGGQNISGQLRVFRNKSTPGTLSFDPKVDFAIPNWNQSISASDFDGDGKIDIAADDDGTNKIAVLKNTSTAGTINASSFSPYISYDVGIKPTYITSGDLDGDNKPELISANYSDSSISILKNKSIQGILDASSFDAKVNYRTGVNPSRIELQDINGDSKLDIYLLNAGSNSVGFLLNNTSSGNFLSNSFSSMVHFSVYPSTKRIALGDINNDGKLDLLTTNTYNNYLSILENKMQFEFTQGSFDLVVRYKSSVGTSGIDGADLDGDNKPELVFINNQGPDVSIYPNNTQTGEITKSSFGSRIDIDNPGAIVGLKVADLDLNGKKDIITADDQLGTVSVYQNYGGNLASAFSKYSYPMLSGVKGPCLNDLNGDGFPEMIAYNYNNVSLAVRQNRSAPGSILYSEEIIIPLDGGLSNKAVDAGDLNGDGRNDIVIGWSDNSNRITLHQNTLNQGADLTSTMFATPVTIQLKSKPTAIKIVDLDGDGKKDIVFAAEPDSVMGILRNISSINTNLSNSSFDTPILFKTDGPMVIEESLRIADINNDGKPDIICGHRGVNIFENNILPGLFTKDSFIKNYYHVQGSGAIVNVADFDSDGKMDLAVSCENNEVGILKNNTKPKINQVIANSLENKTYGDSPFTINTTASSELPVSFKLLSGPGTLNGNIYTITEAGTVTLLLSQNGNLEYNRTQTLVSFEIMKANQSIIFDPISNKNINDPAFNLNANATSGLPVSFILLSGPANISGSLVTLTQSPGKVIIKAIQEGNINYNPAEVSQSIDVSTTTNIEIGKETKSLQGYPNPVKDYLSFNDVNLLLEGYTLKVTDMIGKTVIWNYQAGTSIDLSSLKPGKYSIQLIGDNFIYNGSIIKE